MAACPNKRQNYFTHDATAFTSQNLLTASDCTYLYHSYCLYSQVDIYTGRSWGHPHSWRYSDTENWSTHQNSPHRSPQSSQLHNCMSKSSPSRYSCLRLSMGNWHIHWYLKKMVNILEYFIFNLWFVIFEFMKETRWNLKHYGNGFSLSHYKQVYPLK